MKHWLIILIVALLTGCARFQPQPISVEKTAVDFDARSLTNDDLHTFLETNRVAAEWPQVKRLDRDALVEAEVPQPARFSIVERRPIDRRDARSRAQCEPIEAEGVRKEGRVHCCD